MRIIKILHLTFKYHIDEILVSHTNSYLLRFLCFINPYNLFYYQNKKLAPELRVKMWLIALGPIFIKFGQLLSTRRDLVGDKLAAQLSLLQDKVPPFSKQCLEKILKSAYGEARQEIFQEIVATPLAAASIAVVYAATLHNGAQVVLKILRPNVKKVIAQDIKLLKFLGIIYTKFFAKNPNLQLNRLILEFARTLQQELDLTREASNGSQLMRNFADGAQLKIPKVYWDLLRPNILVMERIYGIPVLALQDLSAAKVDRKQLAQLGVELFLTEVFRDSFFHADMHPGNIFIDASVPQAPKYILVDCAICGSLSDLDRRYIALNLLAFFKRDYRKIAKLHIASGWLPQETRLDLFEAEIRTVSEPIFARALGDISFGQLFLRLLQVCREFGMVIQPQLMLLQKTLLNVEGIARELDPTLNLWQSAQPFLEKWVKSELGACAFMKRVRDNLPNWSEMAPEIPELIYSILTKLNSK